MEKIAEIKRGDRVKVTDFCMTPFLRGCIGEVVRRPRNKRYIVKFKGDGNLYIFSEREVEKN